MHRYLFFFFMVFIHMIGVRNSKKEVFLLHTQISSEQKLQLISAIREEHKHNQNAIRKRESILTGISIPLEEPDAAMDSSQNGLNEEIHHISFRIRLLFSILIFILYVWCDMGSVSVLGLSSEKIQTAIQTDFQANIFDFMDSIPYTLESIQKDE